MDCHAHEEVEDVDIELDPVSNVLPNRHSDNERKDTNRGNWSSQMEYLLSVIGYSVSLTNVLRFPYICSRNGGGAFLIPYIVCLTLCGLPLFSLEAAIGQFCGKSAAHVWSVCPLVKGLGIGMLIISGIGMVAYTAVCSWTLYYVYFSCTTILPWTDCENSWNTEHCVQNIKSFKDITPIVLNGSSINSTLTAHNRTRSLADGGWEKSALAHTAAEEFWQRKVLSISSGVDQIGSVRLELLLCLFLSWAIIFGCVFKGVRSVGKAVYVTATLPYIFLFILLVRGLTLPGGPSGALFYLTPDFSKLLDIQVWLAACTQVFFSLGPAWGGIITLASYNKFHADCLRNAIFCTYVCGGTSLFAGLVVFSVLGFMAHEADVPVTEVTASGPGLGFIVYPEALAQLPVPQLWSFLFFMMLILLVLDTMFSMVETVAAVVFDERPSLLRWRHSVTLGYCFGSFLLGIIITTEGGMYIFQLTDWYIGAIFLFFAGLLECIVFGWIYGVNRLSADIELMTGRLTPCFFRVTWRYVTPAMLVIVFISTLTKYVPPTYGPYVYPDYAVSIGWSLAIIPCIPFVVMVIVTLYKEDGTILQRIIKSLRPDESWGPAHPSYREQYFTENHPISETC